MLGPAKESTENLSAGSINLFRGEGIIKWLMEECESNTVGNLSVLAIKFHGCLKERLRLRRDPLINTLIMYLNNHDSLAAPHPLKLARKAEAVKFGIDLMRRLFPSEEQTPSGESSAAASTSSCLKDRLKFSVGNFHQGSQQQEVVNPYKKEFDYFDRYHTRGPMLNKLFIALCTAQPTSTQSERNFSLAAGIATKQRTRMSDEKINASCFLKWYFKSQNQL